MPLTADQIRDFSGRVECRSRLGPAAALALAVLLAVWPATPLAALARSVSLADGAEAALDEKLEVFLLVAPERGEGWLSFVAKHCGTTSVLDAVRRVNGEQRLLRGRKYRIPFEYLRPERQLELTRALFADDRGVADGWQHKVGLHRSEVAESLWRVAEWFTGRGGNYMALREANGLEDEHLEPGQVVLIPARLLRPVFRQVLPEESAYHLRYDKDAEGEFAIYRLKPGEALYSSVVVRFAGLVFAEDVNSLAAEIAERSGIEDVTDIPIGYEVKVPLSVLLPEFLPAGHPARRQYEESLLASGRYSNQVEARRLQGVTVILDAGHGGRDVGASFQGVWESVHVYDIVLRIKSILEGTTAARVHMTTDDGNGSVPPDRDRLAYNRGHRVLTTPAYPIEDSSTGVNLRWYLTNSLFRRAVKTDGDSGKVVFVSVHADSLHPSLRGAMAYIPGALYRKGSYGKSGAVYAERREVRERPRVSFARDELEKSEGLSRQLAQDFMDAFAAADLEIHPDKPVRNRVVRSRRQAWVPAVLRYSEVPAQLMLEVCNLGNVEDRALIQTRRYRQQVAEAVVQGIMSYYGSDERAAVAAP